MLFNSIEFLIFLPTIFFLYWFIFQRNLRIQNALILVSSYVFYGWWDWRFLSLIALSTVVDFFVGLKIHSSIEQQQKKTYLWISILFNLCLLGFFKYYNFFIDSLINMGSVLGIQLQNTWTLEIILPVGISFYTFQTMSYSLDIYHKKVNPTRDFISFASFVSFFPQLVAGPIEKAHNFLPQFMKCRKISFGDFKFAIFWITYGMFKKIAVADNLSFVVDRFYGNSLFYSENSLLTLIVIIFFSFQIYCDFSGYSDIAIGVARLFGFRLQRNFLRPYFSKGIVEFWRKWHISLSTWFRDYVFISLGGSRISEMRTVINVFIVFILSGLWHGANYTFIIWGMGHFLLYNIDRIIMNNSSNVIINFFKIIICFSAVSLMWIFFRSDSIYESFNIFYNLFQFNYYSFPFSLFVLFKCYILILILLVFDYLLEINIKLVKMPLIIAIWLLIILLGNFDSNNFIYFQF